MYLSIRESMKANVEVGKELVCELGQVCHQQTEVDKVKLFVEEVDKITSLIIGLSSRLAKVRLSQQQHADEKLQVMIRDKEISNSSSKSRTRSLRHEICKIAIISRSLII